MNVLACTVGESIIATTKIRNDYAAIESFFSLLPIVKLSLLILFASFLYQFFASFLMELSLKLSLFPALKAIAKRLPLLLTNAIKSIKERQLLSITIWEAIQKRSHRNIGKITIFKG